MHQVKLEKMIDIRTNIALSPLPAGWADTAVAIHSVHTDAAVKTWTASTFIYVYITRN